MSWAWPRVISESCVQSPGQAVSGGVLRSRQSSFRLEQRDWDLHRNAPRGVLVCFVLAGRSSKPGLSVTLQQCQVQGHSRTQQLSLGVLQRVLTKSSLWRESDWRMEEFIVLLTLPLTCASLLKPLCFIPPWDAEPQTSHGPARNPCAQDSLETVLCNIGQCCHLYLPLCGAP